MAKYKVKRNLKINIKYLSKRTYIIAGMLTIASIANAALYEKDGFRIDTDFRLRMETDWESNSRDGAMRDDRTRFRIRGRVGINYDFLDYFSLAARARTGANASHQASHMTLYDFNNNPTVSKDINFDKWFLKAKVGNAWGWAGRNSLPFWKQNELFWDDDVTPVGVAAGYKFDLGGNHKLAVNSAYLLLPTGMLDFAGEMFAGQLVYSTKVDGYDLTLVSGIYGVGADGNAGKADNLLNGNGMRDYTIVQVSAQMKTNIKQIPLKLGVDFYHNAESYSKNSSNSYTTTHHGHRDGFVFSTALGNLKKQGSWVVGYSYAYIEALAVNSSYAQDDWVRWGSAFETRSTDMKGHEVRLGYALIKKTNVLLRFYNVDAISTSEDGKRVRLDFNYKL